MGKQSEKQQLEMVLSELYSKANSVEQFYTMIKDRGLKLYFRGKEPGIIGNNRKYRLKTLGYSKGRIALLTLEKSQQKKQLRRLTQLGNKQQDLEQEY
ncbi:hypothetical protein ACFSTE_09355 [Aquimarina hainanensis]|uniref:Uncharacterized protein n=1 Tax=Aquimarina hainanensis TaxID=1578017 RepID=A0ABW5N5X9_9FLAO